MSILDIRLRDCATSNRIGMGDRMFPRAMAQLETMGRVRLDPRGGYWVTEAGHAHLQMVRYNERLFATRDHGRHDPFAGVASR